MFVTGQQEVHLLCGKLRKTFTSSVDRKAVFEDRMTEELEASRRRGRRKGVVSSENFELDELVDMFELGYNRWEEWR